MLIRQVALLSKTKKVTPDELMRVSAALQKQVTRDLSPIWSVKATVDSFHSEGDVPAGYWRIRVMDKIPQDNATGFHFDERGQPQADVQWSPTWSLTASHECLEMLVDPFGRQTQSGPSPNSNQGRVNFLVEICDPCEDFANAYTINTGASNEVVVSDFYTPEYFSPSPSSGARYSFKGAIRTPRQVLNGGYLSWSNPSDGHIWQLFGPIGMGHFVDQGPGILERKTTDGYARRTRSKYAAKYAKPLRRARLTEAAGGNCNLTSDQVTGVFRGVANTQTTVQIKDSTGQAIFQSISYGDNVIGTNTAAVTFGIVSGTSPLTFVYAAPIPGDDIVLTDPCGNQLDKFKNDPGNPFSRHPVVA